MIDLSRQKTNQSVACHSLNISHSTDPKNKKLSNTWPRKRLVAQSMRTSETKLVLLSKCFSMTGGVPLHPLHDSPPVVRTAELIKRD